MAIEIQQITDYTINLSLLLEQYKKSTKLNGLIDSTCDQADDLESALFELRNLFYLATAEGIQLDIIGSIFGVERMGLNDDDYRSLIAFFGSFIKSGEPESIITILKRIYAATFVTYIPSYPAVPAGYYLITDATITLAELEVLSPAGVQPYLAGFLLDEAGNNIVDEEGNKILHVS
jgi:hypothetical protein